MNKWDKLDIVIYEDLYLKLEKNLYPHHCMTSLLSLNDLNDEIIAGVYNKVAVEGQSNDH